jgi:hypothetical protein
MNVARLGLAALCAAALTACSSSSTPPSPASLPANPGGGPVAAQHDPCALFSTDQLNSAFGLKLGAGTAEQGSLLPTCDWYDTAAGTSVAVGVKKADQPNFDSELSGSAKAEYQRTTPVIGDDSVWFDPNATDTVSLIAISKGYRYQVSLAVGSSTIDQRRTQLITLAQSVF